MKQTGMSEFRRNSLTYIKGRALYGWELVNDSIDIINQRYEMSRTNDQERTWSAVEGGSIKHLPKKIA